MKKWRCLLSSNLTKIQHNPRRILGGLFGRNQETNCKIHMEVQRAKSIQNTLKITKQKYPPFEGGYVQHGPSLAARGKDPACQSRRRKRHRFDPWVGKIP